jgi:uncharacterized protein YraI
MSIDAAAQSTQSHPPLSELEASAPGASTVRAPHITHHLRPRRGDLVRVNRSALNCRAWMSTAAPIATVLRKGEQAVLLSDPCQIEKQDWVKVRLVADGSNGYVAARYVDVVESGFDPVVAGAEIDDQPIETPTHYETGDLLTTTTRLNLRAGPGIHHPIQRKIGSNLLGIVLDEPELVDSVAWAPVRFPQGSGWIAAQHSAFLSRDSKWIEADLTTQRLTAWIDATEIASEQMSSGRPDFPTPIGNFPITAKIPTRRLRGDVRGEVWDIPGVPWIMIFRRGGFYSHAVYWHEAFGQPVSHGCLTLPVPFAEWLYEWTPPGTRLWIHL